MFQYIRLLRPHQWLKSVFVFAGIIFAHQWYNKILLGQVIIVAVAFSLIASAIYIINDYLDRHADSQHLLKKHRPLAADIVNIYVAILLAAVIAILGLVFGFLVSYKVGLILLAYLGLNVFYSLLLKYWVIIDVLSIATGFLLRVLAGTVGVNIPPSSWLLLCTFLLALFLGLCKRRTELKFGISHYSIAWLDKGIIVIGAGTTLSYTFYCLRQQNFRLFYTIPLVVYGLFRHLYLLNKPQNRFSGIDIAKDILVDWQLLLVITVWVFMVLMA